jgi:hypothetical protein
MSSLSSRLGSKSSWLRRASLTSRVCSPALLALLSLPPHLFSEPLRASLMVGLWTSWLTMTWSCAHAEGRYLQLSNLLKSLSLQVFELQKASVPRRSRYTGLSEQTLHVLDRVRSRESR